MRIIYPSNPLQPKKVEDLYAEEYEAARLLGIDVAIFGDESWSGEQALTTKPSIEPGDEVLYRGWMMQPKSYQALCDQVRKCGATTVTSPEEYRSTHYIDGWYQGCADLTPRTVLLSSRKELIARIEELSWEKYFIKDFVKSNSGPKGSVATTIADAQSILDELEMYRGDIEGGIALREYEHYETDSERRYFVACGVAFGASGRVPEIVEAISRRLTAPFYSVDVIETIQGDHRLVELGDGQVSDRKEWDAPDFAKQVLSKLAESF